MASGSENVMAIVRDVKSAEAEADRLLEDAQAKTEELKRRGLTQAQQQRRKGEEANAQWRTEALRKGHAEIEQEVKRKITQAEKKAEQIRAVRISKIDRNALARWALEKKK